MQDYDPNAEVRFERDFAQAKTDWENEIKKKEEEQKKKAEAAKKVEQERTKTVEGAKKG